MQQWKILNTGESGTCTVLYQSSVSTPSWITSYYSLTDPGVMEGWVGHVGWRIADGITTKWSPVWRKIGKVRRPRPAFYPLWYTANVI